jgi:dipeptidyl-peptidase-3
MEARLGITQWLIDHDLASVELKHDSDGKLVDAYARIDREKVLSNGQKVMGELLLNLQVLKSTGDEKGANGKSFLAPSLLPFPYWAAPTVTAFYKKLTTPYDSWVSDLRPLVFAKKLPRKIFVQPNTAVNSDGEVELLEYPVSVEGVIQSFVERGL